MKEKRDLLHKLKSKGRKPGTPTGLRPGRMVEWDKSQNTGGTP